MEIELSFPRPKLTDAPARCPPSMKGSKTAVNNPSFDSARAAAVALAERIGMKSEFTSDAFGNGINSPVACSKRVQQNILTYLRPLNGRSAGLSPSIRERKDMHCHHYL